MPEKGCNVLKIARKAAGLTQEEMENILAVSLSTIKRWENGETMPTPEDVEMFGLAVSDDGLWHRWMIAAHPSYASRFKNAASVGLTASVLRVRHAIEDVMEHQNAMERDSIDGVIDNADRFEEYIDDLKSLASLILDVIPRIGGKKNG